MFYDKRKLYNAEIKLIMLVNLQTVPKWNEFTKVSSESGSFSLLLASFQRRRKASRRAFEKYPEIDVSSCGA